MLLIFSNIYPENGQRRYNSVQILQTYTFLSFPMLKDSNGIFFNPFDPAVQKFKIFIFIFPLLLLLFYLSFMWEVYHFETGYSAPGHFVISFRNPLNPRDVILKHYWRNYRRSARNILWILRNCVTILLISIISTKMGWT